MAYAQYEGTYVPQPGHAQEHPVFPSMGSTLGGVTHTHMYDNPSQPTSSGSASAHGPARSYMSFPPAPLRPGASGSVALDEVRTVFITGFPADVRDRELHNLVRFLPGFEASQMAVKPGQSPHGFVLFNSAAHAHQALDAIAGVPFDSGGAQPTSVAETACPHSSAHAATSTFISDDEQRMLQTRLSHPVTGTTPTGNGILRTGSNTGMLISSHSASCALPILTSQAGTGNGVASGSPHALAPGAKTSAPSHHLLLLGSDPTSGPVAGNGLSAPPAPPPVMLAVKLRAEMAHKNLYMKEADPTICRPHRHITLLPQPGGAMHMQLAHAASGGQLFLHPSAVTSTDMSTFSTRPSGSVYNGVGGGMHPLAAAAAGRALSQPQLQPQVIGTGMSSASGLPMAAPLGFLPVTNRGDNTPCNTLFIGNLSDQVSEIELLQLFSGQPGYRQMKLVRGPRQVSCFVEFDDLETAIAVHAGLQGAVLVSSDRGGIRIQFSKNPFGRRQTEGLSNLQAPPPGQLLTLYRTGASTPGPSAFMGGSNFATAANALGASGTNNFALASGPGAGNYAMAQQGNRGMLLGPGHGGGPGGYNQLDPHGQGHGHGHGHGQMLQSFPLVAYPQPGVQGSGNVAQQGAGQPHHFGSGGGYGY